MAFPKPTFHPLGQVDESILKYAVIVARYQGKWIFCRHNDRATWELPGGHREPGETPLETARRELYEETGATAADIRTVGVYKLFDYGLLCFAEVTELGPIPAGSEIEEIQFFGALPLSLTYAGVHDQLYHWIQGWMNMQSSAGELWDVYDKDRNLTGRTHRRGDFLPEGDYHLTVHVWLLNSRGEFLLTKRSPKKGFPNMWEATGGSALAGDDSLTAAIREVREETGLNLLPENGQCVISYRHIDHFTDVWLFRQDFDLADVRLLEGETCDKMYASREVLLQLRRDGVLVPFRYLDRLLDRIKAENALSQMGYTAPLSIHQFQNEEDEGFYQVWRVNYPECSYVLKQAKGSELELYRSFLGQPCAYAPRLFAAHNRDGADFLLMEYIPGNDLMRCSREDLICALNSLIAMQSEHWMADDLIGSFERSLEGRRNRRKFLHDARLEAAYDAYLEEFEALPRTLCHDDLLPFNVIVSNGRAVFIDWEVGGILPYPTSLARLIAHADEDENAFFFMADADKSYAIEYYYGRFVKGRGVAYDAYRRSLDLALFYEYCEWVYVGNKYGETDNERFRSYLRKATDMAIKLGF